MRIPPEVAEYLELRSKKHVKLQTEHTQKHGRYLSAWNPDQQEKENEEEPEFQKASNLDNEG